MVINAISHAFPVYVITIWNRLSADVLASSLLSLKTRLTNVDFTYTLIGKV